MGYTGRLVNALVKKHGGNTASREAAKRAEVAIDAKYGHVDDGTEYEHVAFKKRNSIGSWVTESDFKKSVKKSATLKSPHSMAGVSKPSPKRVSPQKLLTEGRKPKAKRESPKYDVLVTPAPVHKPKFRVGSSFSKEFHQKNNKGDWVANKITYTIVNFNPQTQEYNFKITELLSRTAPKHVMVKESKVKAFNQKLIDKANEQEALFNRK